MSVLIVTVDCLRADHVGCYGYERPTTPTLDSLALEGVALNGFANSPGTRWALQTIHTGAYHGQFDGVGIPEDYGAQLAAKFSSAGYSTGGFACNGFLSRDYGYNQDFDTFVGVSDFREQSFVKNVESRLYDLFPDWVIQNYIGPIYRRLNASTGHGVYRPPVADSDTVDHASKWIKNQSDKWFAWVHLMDAHTPYGRWNDHLKALRGNTDIRHVVSPTDIEEGDEPNEATIDTYDSGIRSADQQISRLLELVDENTTILITGDHGEEFGRYGDFHSASLYSSMTQVPFIIQSPHLEFDTSGRIHKQAQHVDIAPTLADAADIQLADEWVGESLMTPPNTERHIWHHVDDSIGVRIGDWKLIDNNGTQEVFRTPYGENDSYENDDDQDTNVRSKLGKSLMEYQEFCQQYPLGRGEAVAISEAEISAEVESNLEDLGYR